MNYLQRKKLAFMSIVNSVKGFVRTVLGIPPLTLPNCVDDKSVISYKIYGNSFQDGTPSPDNPVDVVSVGDRTRNLLDIQNANKTLTRCVSENVGNGVKITATEDGVAGYITIYLNDNVTKGKTYSISFISERSGSTGGGIRVTIDGKLSINVLSYAGGYYKGTFTAGDTNILAFYCNTNSGYKDDFAIFTDVQIEEGETVTDYEPYGYKIPVVAINAEKVDKRIVNILQNSGTDTNIENGYDWLITQISDNAPNTTPGAVSYSSGWKNMTKVCTQGKYYKIVYDIEYLEVVKGDVSFPITHRLGVHYNSGKYNDVLIENLGKTYHIEYSWCYDEIASSANANPFLTLNSCKVKISNFRLYESDEAIEPITTNIYLDEPLRKIGDYTDTIDFERGKVVRNVFEYVFTGRETWVTPMNAFDNTIRSYAKQVTPRINANVSFVGFSEKGIFDGNSTASGDKERCQFSNFDAVSGSFYARILKSRCANPDDAQKTDFANIYTEGTKVYGVLETPTEESITLPTLPTHKGTTIYEVNTTTHPSNMEVTYYSTQKGE